MISSDYNLALSAILCIEPIQSSENSTTIHLWGTIEEGIELVKKISDSATRALLFKLACQKYCENGQFAEARKCAQNLKDPSTALAYIELFQPG